MLRYDYMASTPIDNKTIAGIVIAVLALGGAWYLFTTQAAKLRNEISAPVATTTPTAAAPAQKQIAPKPTRTPSASKPVASTGAATGGVGSITSLLALKQSLSCDIETINPIVKRSGTLYVDSGRVRGDFITYIDGNKVSTSMIDDGTSLYAWTSGSATGLKLPAALSASGSAIASHGGIDLAATFNYSCNPWAANASLFIPPASITFSTSGT